MHFSLNLGNLDSALDIINTLLKKYPKNKNLLKAKTKVERKSTTKSKKVSKQSKRNEMVSYYGSPEKFLFPKSWHITGN